MTNQRDAAEADVLRAAAIIMNWRMGNAGEDDATDTARLVLASLPAASEEEPVADILRKRFPYVEMQEANRAVTVHWFDVVRAVEMAVSLPAPSDQEKLVGKLVEALLEAHARFVGIERSRGRREYVRNKARIAGERAGAVLERILPITRARQNGGKG